MADKLKLAFYWAASCGGCEIAVLDIDEKILEVAKIADILFWPCAMDFKYKDVEAMPDQHIDVCFFNGAIRNTEHEHIAHLLRQKSKVMIAYGACACWGGIKGLGNFFKTADLLDRAYEQSETVDNPNHVLPQASTQVKEGELTLPTTCEFIRSLDQVIKVEYYIPGCPPTPPVTSAAIDMLASGMVPPAPAILGGHQTVCEECPRKKSEKKIKGFKRVHEVIPEPETCLLEQGIICMGIATRSGCAAQCPTVNMPCRGCFGPAPNIVDHGAKLISGIASVLESKDEEEIAKVINQIVDPAGTFYRYTLGAALLNKNQACKVEYPAKKAANPGAKKEEVTV